MESLTQQKLVLARKALGLTQSQVSNALGLRQALISTVEANSRTVPIPLLEMYVKYGINLSAVFDMEIDADDFAAMNPELNFPLERVKKETDWSGCPACKEKDLQLASLQLRIKSLEEVADALRSSLRTYQRIYDQPQGG